MPSRWDQVRTPLSTQVQLPPFDARSWHASLQQRRRGPARRRRCFSAADLVLAFGLGCFFTALLLHRP